MLQLPVCSNADWFMEDLMALHTHTGCWSDPIWSPTQHILTYPEVAAALYVLLLTFLSFFFKPRVNVTLLIFLVTTPWTYNTFSLYRSEASAAPVLFAAQSVSRACTSAAACCSVCTTAWDAEKLSSSPWWQVEWQNTWARTQWKIASLLQSLPEGCIYSALWVCVGAYCFKYMCVYDGSLFWQWDVGFFFFFWCVLSHWVSYMHVGSRVKRAACAHFLNAGHNGSFSIPSSSGPVESGNKFQTFFCLSH